MDVNYSLRPVYEHGLFSGYRLWRELPQLTYYSHTSIKTVRPQHSLRRRSAL